MTTYERGESSMTPRTKKRKMAVTAGVYGGAGGDAANNGGGGVDAANLNQRMAALLERLSIHALAEGTFDPFEFKQLCISLSRGIDFYTANNEVYSRASELPSLFKKVCESNKNTPLLQPPLMVLMFSVKNACQSGWFPVKSSGELITLANEICSCFGNLTNLSNNSSHSHPVISAIISRFYPRIKMGHILTLLEAKPGFDAYLSDFQISRTLRCTPGEKVRLFVIQKDNIETSCCLIGPPKVNFLLNGKGVDNRTTVFVDTGPQTPTIITHYLKYGCNLLQAVGEFDGNYVIAVAITSDVANTGVDVLQDYEHAPTLVDSDSEIVEGSSRIPLNCPISLKRIKAPVKGRLCKHIQCFDFHNYVEINSRRPSWRCPCCNQHVCFTDIRIDKKMDMVLKEIGPVAHHVVFSLDGSWKAAAETGAGDAMQKPENEASSEKDASLPPECVSSPNAIMDFLDLTEIDDVIDDFANTETADEKVHNPNQTSFLNSDVAIPDTSRHVGSRVQTTHASTSSPGYAGSHSNLNNAQSTTFMPQNGIHPPYMWMQHPIGNPYPPAGYGSFPSIPRPITTPIMAPVPLPMQAPSNVQQQRSANGQYNLMQYGFPPVYPTSSLAPAGNTIPPNPHHFPQVSHFPLYMHPGVQVPRQNTGLQASNQVPSTSNQQMANNMMHPAPTRPSILQFGRQYPHSVGAQMSGDPSRATSPRPVNMNTQSTTSESYDPADQSWRPAGRMRGALSGQDYVDALNQYIIRPNQQTGQSSTPTANRPHLL